MKKMITLCAMFLLTMTLFAGCGKTKEETVPPSDTNSGTENQPDSSDTQIPDEDDGGTGSSDTAAGDTDTINKMLQTLKNDDAKVVTILGEGTATKAEGSDTVTAREYTIDFMDKQEIMTISYGDDQIANQASIMLSGTELDPYKTLLEEVLGTVETTSEDKEEGNGLKLYGWTKDGVSITLKQAYGSISIEAIEEVQ